MSLDLIYSLNCILKGRYYCWEKIPNPCSRTQGHNLGKCQGVVCCLIIVGLQITSHYKRKQRVH